MRRLLAHVVGALLAGLGIAAIIYGGIVAATGPSDGSHPHEFAGFIVILAGLAVLTLGLWLVGVDFT